MATLYYFNVGPGRADALLFFQIIYGADFKYKEITFQEYSPEYKQKAPFG